MSVSNRLNKGSKFALTINGAVLSLLDKYPVISELKARKKLKSPIVLVNDVIKSIGRYPDNEEVRKWKPGDKDS